MFQISFRFATFYDTKRASTTRWLFGESLWKTNYSPRAIWGGGYNEKELNGLCGTSVHSPSAIAIDSPS